MTYENTKGIVTEIERYSIHDGTGVRSAVFFKGCPLRCRWCCNPETQNFFPEPCFAEEKCVACGRCAEACRHLGRGDDGKPSFARDVCGELCGKGEETEFSCARACYYKAVRRIGEKMTTEQVMREVMRDINYYDSTGGGVTFTGGEPFCQPDFLMALLRASSRMYLNAAVETCGAGKLEDYKRAMPLLDMFFLDVKCADPTKSEDWLGCKLDKLLADIRAISRFALEFDVRLFIRIPIIPGFNDTIEDIGAIAEFINELPRVDGVELLPYHKLGRGKYRLVGRNYSLWDLETPQQNFIAKLSDIIRKTGIDEVSF